MVVGLTSKIDMNTATVDKGSYELTTYVYDFKNHLKQSQDAMGKISDYTADMFGNVLKTVDRNGNVINTTYNPYGNILTQKVTKPDGTTESISKTYDILGNIKTMADSTGTTTYTYDGFGVVIQLMGDK